MTDYFCVHGFILNLNYGGDGIGANSTFSFTVLFYTDSTCFNYFYLLICYQE